MKRSVKPRPFLHAVRTLELSAVLDIIAGHCKNAPARLAIRSLSPMSDAAMIASALADCAELRRFHDERGDIPIADTSYTDFLDRSTAGSETATPAVLLDIAAAERAAADLARCVRPAATKFPRLAACVETLQPDDALAREIDRAIDADGNVRDNASPELKRVRHEMKKLRSSLRALAEKLVGGFGEGALSTVMGSRHALIVPRASVHRGDGLVHSASASGGSLYFEPAALVERNNELETLVADESIEVARILGELSARVRAAAPRLLENADVINRLDALRARAAFARKFDCVTPVPAERGTLRLASARHPLLVRALEDAGNPGATVPLDLLLTATGRVLVISGPNAGGKTVSIKTLGICALLHQCGLQVPCAAATQLPVFDRIFVDIGDEQSMASSLSTFTSHLKNLDAMSRGATADSLCLVDEIGDGTDPDEGAALAIATMEKLLRSGALAVATTHFGRIKTWALECDGVANASMAFADGEDRPLYRLLQGIAGRSRGIETARRTGFDPGVVARARELVGKEAYRLESLLADLERARLEFDAQTRRLREQRDELERQTAEYREKSDAYNLTRREMQKKALREAEEVLTEARREVEQVVRHIRVRKADKQAIQEGHLRVSRRLDTVRRDMKPLESPARSLERVAVGDRVSVSAAGTPAGTVIAVENRRAQVEIAGKRITIPVDRLYAAADSPPPAQQTTTPAGEVAFESLTSTTADIRGRDREDAMGEVARFVDRAVVSGVQEVKIIHGVGSGVLSAAVRTLLFDDPRVESLRHGEQQEGGVGVTLVRFK